MDPDPGGPKPCGSCSRSGPKHWYLLTYIALCSRSCNLLCLRWQNKVPIKFQGFLPVRYGTFFHCCGSVNISFGSGSPTVLCLHTVPFANICGCALELLCQTPIKWLSDFPEDPLHKHYLSLPSCPHHRAPTHSPLPLCVAKTGKNQLNEEITPLLSTGIGDRFSQTISNLVHAVPCADVNSPYKRKRWTNSGVL